MGDQGGSPDDGGGIVSKRGWHPLSVSLVAGAAAGTAVDVSLFPLDTLKTRLQSAQGFRKAGGFSRIYAGLGPAALGSAPNAAAFFVTYEAVKAQASKAAAGQEDDPRCHMLAASCGEVMACLVRVPVEVVKQRLQSGNEASFSSAVRNTLAREGWTGFYRGYLTTVMREIPFSLIQFPLWEFFKSALRSSKSGTDHPAVEPYESAMCGALAGGISAGLTTPLDVAKTRIMLAAAGSDMARKQSTVFAVKTVWSEKGIRGLFAGVAPRVTWISVGGAVFFGCYEFVSKHLKLLALAN